MNIDLLRQQQRWKDGLQELRTGFASLESQAGFHCHIPSSKHLIFQCLSRFKTQTYYDLINFY